MPVLLEVNVSGEASKHGFGMEELLHAVDELDALPGLRIEGLMTMAPVFDMLRKRDRYSRLCECFGIS